jgi:hypothetical protein
MARINSATVSFFDHAAGKLPVNVKPAIRKQSNNRCLKIRERFLWGMGSVLHLANELRNKNTVVNVSRNLYEDKPFYV